MTTNRRAFLRTLAASAAAIVLDPERLLWVPGQKTIFLPPVTPWKPSPHQFALIAGRRGGKSLQMWMRVEQLIAEGKAVAVVRHGHTAVINNKRSLREYQARFTS